MTEKHLLNSFHYIVSKHFGDISVDILKKLLPEGDEGVDIQSIMLLSQNFGLDVQQAVLDIEDIDSANMPCILIYERRSYVLLEMDATKAVVYDPKYDAKKDLDKSFLNHTHPDVLFFEKTESSSEILESTHKTKEWFWGYFKDEWQAFAEVGVLTLFINFFVLAVPLYVMNVYDRVIPNFAVETLAVLAFGVILLLLFDLLFKSARVYIVESIGKKISSKLEEQLMHKTLTLEPTNDSLLAGSKANLFKELGQISDFFASKTILHILDFPFFVIIIGVIWIISPLAAMVAIFGAIIIFAINFLMHYPISNISQKMYEKGQTKQNYIFENLKGIETIKLSNALNSRLYKWRNILNFFSKSSKDVQIYNNLATNLSYFVLQLVTVVVIIVGVYEIQDKNITVGALIAITILSSRAMAPIVNLSTIITKIKDFSSILDSMDKYWNLPSEGINSATLGVGRLKGEIEFDRVSFSYPESKVPNIDSMSFKIKAGEKVGIIGKTGAGKSTVARLITSIDRPSSGNIFIDNHNLLTIHPFELRENIGVMSQEPYLFAGTLAENIELDKPLGKDRLIKLIKEIGLGDLLKRNEKAEAQYVGENGSRLSVGQRHLVALGRALIKDPPILILDEPTTGMDVGLENELIEHLKPVVKDKTLFVITHRFAALELVQRVIVVNDGKIVADGEKEKVLAMLNKKRT